MALQPPFYTTTPWEQPQVNVDDPWGGVGTPMSPVYNYPAPQGQLMPSMGAPPNFGLPATPFPPAPPQMGAQMPGAPLAQPQEPQGPWHSILANMRGSDAGLRAAIFAHSFTHPGEALQAATRLQEARNQREFQQAQLQEQIAARKEIAKQQAEVVKERQRFNTFEAGKWKMLKRADIANINFQDLEQALGKPMEAWDETDLPHLDAILSVKERADQDLKDQRKAIDDKGKLLRSAAKGLPIGKTPYDNDPEFKQQIAEVTRIAKEDAATQREYNKARIEATRLLGIARRKAIQKASGPEGDPAAKAQMDLLKDEIDQLQSRERQVREDLRTLDVKGEEATGYGLPINYATSRASYNTELTDITKQMQAKVAELSKIAGAKVVGPTTTTATSNLADKQKRIEDLLK